uniref:CCHC-type domain-containing protein n=1 Tax=Quercus lobata TaxID=97700 RepID=A0A7N2R5R6_QUELO
MLVEALTDKTKKLRCTGNAVKLKASEKAVEELFNTGLVGKLLADRNINKNAVKAIILKVWRTSKGVQIVDLKENIFVFKFACEVDDLDFSSIPLWVQIHGLPIEYMSKENAEEIGALVGEVLEVDFTGSGGVCMSKFLRVKVELKVEDPLLSGFFLDRNTQPNLWIRFKYERIAEFCFKCGRLGHLKARCIWADAEVQSNSKEPFGFGPWLKAEAASNRASRWVEFIADNNQACEEVDVGRKESVSQEQEESRVHALQVVGTKETQAVSSRHNLESFEIVTDSVTSKYISLSKVPNYSTPSQLNTQTNSSETTNLIPLIPMETDCPVTTKPVISTQSMSSTNTESSRIQRESSPSKEYQPLLADPGLSDPSVLIGLSKAQDNVLSWTVYYNEGEKSVLESSKAQSTTEISQIKVLNRGKRKLEEEGSPVNLRALKLTKVGSGLLKLEPQSNVFNQISQNKSTGRAKVHRKKKIKDLARGHAALVPYNSSQEVNFADPISVIDDESLKSKVAEEAGLHMPPMQP